MTLTLAPARPEAVPAPGTDEAWAELPARHALMTTALEQLPLGLSMFDAEDCLLVANQRYRDLRQLPATLCQPGARFVDLIAANAATELPCIDPFLAEAAAAGQPSRRRREWLLRDGRLIGVTITRLPGGACVAMHEDITEQRRNEQKMEASPGRHGSSGSVASIVVP